MGRRRKEQGEAAEAGAGVQMGRQGAVATDSVRSCCYLEMDKVKGGQEDGAERTDRRLSRNGGGRAWDALDQGRSSGDRRRSESALSFSVKIN